MQASGPGSGARPSRNPLALSVSPSSFPPVKSRVLLWALGAGLTSWCLSWPGCKIFKDREQSHPNSCLS